MNSAPAAGFQPLPANELAAAVQACVLGHRAALDRAERDGRLPAEVIAELSAMGFFHAMRPREFGGLEIGYDEVLALVSAVAEHSASLAWFMVLMSTHNMMMRISPRQMAEQIYGDRPMLLASSVFPKGRAVPVPGGFRLSGTWKYVTGIHYANWVTLTADVADADGVKEAKFIVPASDCTVLDDWDSLGMRATGSNSIRVDDVFVPGLMRVRENLARFTGEGADIKVPVRYRMPSNVVVALGTMAPICGILRGAVASLGINTTEPLSASRVALEMSLMKFRARAKLIEHAYWQEVTLNVEATRNPAVFTPIYQYEVMLRCAQLAHQSRELISEIFAWVGTKAASPDARVGRAMMDINVLSTHFLLKQEIGAVTLVLMESDRAAMTDKRI